MHAHRYWAFLSYSHADSAVAAQLHRALERYVIPRRVRAAYGLPRRLFPVFRDVDELEAASALNARLQRALDESACLIVLCSPAAAQSKYVNDEIEYFLARHGASRLLCVLADGDPPQTMPPAIRALPSEPLAADLRRGADFRTGVLRIVAAMAGVGFTELHDRERRRRIQQRLGLAATLGATALGAVATWDLTSREHVQPYAHYQRVNGIWQGVDPLSFERAAHRNEYFRFVRRGRINPPERVDFLNGSGRCPGNGMPNVLGDRHAFADEFEQPSSRYCSVRFEYRRDGELARETWTNEQGHALETLSFTEADLAQFTQQGFAAAGSQSGVQYVQFVRDGQGCDVELRFLQSRGVPRSNRDHHFGYRVAYDDAGRVAMRSALDDGGAEVGEVVRWRYDAGGDVIEERYEDAAGRLRTGKEGYSGIRVENGSYGNWRARDFYGPDGQPVSGADGYARQHALWNDAGVGVGFSFFDESGKAVVNRYGYAVERREVDRDGRIRRWQWLDVDQRPVMLEGNYAAVELDYDDRGSLIETRYLGPDGKLTDSFVAAVVRKRNDALGRSVSECFFDSKGQPTLTRWGHCILRTYDERDYIAEFRFVDVEGKPYLRDDRGFARVLIHRDARANPIRWEYFDAALRPVVAGAFKGAVVEVDVDDLGNLVERRVLDAAGRLMTGGDGVAVYRLRYDRSGNVIEETYLNEMRVPVRGKEGYFGYRAAYDKRGRLLSRHFIDASGAPMPVGDSGRAGVLYAYDVLGRVASETHEATDGTVLGTMVFERDRLGRTVLSRYLDRSGQAAADPRTGCSLLRTEYTVWGDPSMERCLDAAERAINRTDTGWAVRRSSYENSRKLGERLFDAEGREIVQKTSVTAPPR